MHHLPLIRPLIGCLALLTLVACDNQSRGFALPPGDADAGRSTFLSLHCNQCHTVHNDIAKHSEGHPDIHFVLGGPTTRVRTYGDLVTSIINPSHKISGYPRNTEAAAANVNDEGESNMRVYNRIMTVQQLVDLTTYLQDSYEIVRPQYQPYHYGP